MDHPGLFLQALGKPRTRPHQEVLVDPVHLTGFDGGEIAEICHMHVHVPSCNYGLVEDLHLAVGHMISQALKSRLMKEEVTA